MQWVSGATIDIYGGELEVGQEAIPNHGMEAKRRMLGTLEPPLSQPCVGGVEKQFE